MHSVWITRHLFALQIVSWILVTLPLLAFRRDLDFSLVVSGFLVTAPALPVALILAAVARWIVPPSTTSLGFAPAVGLLAGNALAVVGTIKNVITISRAPPSILTFGGPEWGVVLTPFIWGLSTIAGCGLGVAIFYLTRGLNALAG